MIFEDFLIHTTFSLQIIDLLVLFTICTHKIINIIVKIHVTPLKQNKNYILVWYYVKQNLLQAILYSQNRVCADHEENLHRNMFDTVVTR